MSAPPIAFLNARLVDPERETETRGGLLAMDGVIAGVGPAVTRDQLPREARVVDGIVTFDKITWSRPLPA